MQKSGVFERVWTSLRGVWTETTYELHVFERFSRGSKKSQAAATRISAYFAQVTTRLRQGYAEVARGQNKELWQNRTTIVVRIFSIKMEIQNSEDRSQQPEWKSDDKEKRIF